MIKIVLISLAGLVLLYLFFTQVCCYNFGEIRNIQHRNVLSLPAHTRKKVFADTIKLAYQYLGSKPLWINYGTLLGAVREKTIICYDDDVDFSMKVEDYPFALEQIERLVAEHPEYTFAKVNVGPLVKCIVLIHRETGLPSDITFYEQSGDSWERVVIGRYISSLREQQRVDIPNDWLFPLQVEYLYVEGEQIPVLVPSQPDKFLSLYY